MRISDWSSDVCSSDLGEVMPIPADLDRVARAAGSMPPRHPELPAAVDHAVMLRGSARHKAGGLDTASYASWYAALIDLSLRLSGLVCRNAACETAFVADRRSPRLNSSHTCAHRMPSSA